MPAPFVARFLIPVALAASVALSGCGGPEPAPGPFGTAYVGAVPGSEFFIGLGMRGQSLTALLTDGRISGFWFQGNVSGNSLYLTSTGNARLSGRIEEGRITGTVELGNRSLAFDALLAEEGGGLFRSEGAGGELTGWVVLPDGRQKGVRTRGGRTTPAPPLSVFAPTAEE